MPDAIPLDQDEVLWLLAKAIDQRQPIDGLKIVRQWMDGAADRIAELEAALAKRVAEIKLLQEELIEARTHYGFGPGRRYQIMNCDHPWHRNPGLITICPQCAISAAKEADRVATMGPALIIPTIGPTPGTAVLAAKGGRDG